MGELSSLGEVQETLLIPLCARARDAQRRVSVLEDHASADLLKALDYDFSKFRGPSLLGSVLRASIFDGYVRDFLRKHPDGTVVDLGCGLSTRFDRLDNGRVRWFDLDLADTMALRRKFFDDTDRYTMLTGSIFDTEWHDRVRERSGPLFLLSEAVLLYFPEPRVDAVLQQIAAAFPDTPLAIDTGGAAMINSQDRNPVFTALSARMQWTCDSPVALERNNLHLHETRTFGTPQPDIAHTWPARYRYPLKALRWTRPVKTYKVNLFTTEAGNSPD